MALQIKRLPTALKFTPDIPTSSLAIDEYNDGANVEYDVRGIRSVAGDTAVLNGLPNNFIPIYITGGFRNVNAIQSYYLIVAAYNSLNQGKWFAYSTNDNNGWVDITPSINGITDATTWLDGYTRATNITSSWNGTTLILNDGINAPMFFGDDQAKIIPYSQRASKIKVWDIVKQTPNTTYSYKVVIGSKNTCSVSGTSLTITTVGENDYYIGMSVYSTTAGSTFIPCKITGKVSSTQYILSISQPSLTSQVIVSNPWPSYLSSNDGQNTWWRSEILSIKNSLSGFDDYDWTIYISTVKSQYTVGISIKNDPTGYGNTSLFAGVNCYIQAKYIWNYDAAMASSVAQFVRLYNTPNVGSILVAGNFTFTDANNLKKTYSTTLAWSQAFGLSDVPITWEPTITNVANQLEVPVQGALLDGFSSAGNFYVASYFDTAILSPLNYTSTSAPILSVRPFNPGRGMYSSNCWVQTDTRVFGIDSRDVWEFSDGQFKSLGNQAVKNFLANSIDPDFINRIFMVNNSNKYQMEVYYVSDNAPSTVPDKMLAYRYDVGLWNAPRNVSYAVYAAEIPVLYRSGSYYRPDLSTKTILYVRSLSPTSAQFAMKDIGSSFLSFPVSVVSIYAYVKKDGIPLGDTFNQQMTVHRVYPELSQLGINLETNRNTQIAPTGFVDVYLNGANSPGTPYKTIGVGTLSINAADQDPYVQYEKATYRSHGIQISGTSTETEPNIWFCSGVNIQYSQEKVDS